MRNLPLLLLLVGVTFAMAGAASQPAVCTEPLPRMEDSLGIQGKAGAFVTSVLPDSAAEHAGFKQCDLIVGFDGKTLRDFPNFVTFVAELRIAAIRGTVAIDLLKYDVSSRSYSASRTGVTLAGSSQTLLGYTSVMVYLVQEVTTGRPAASMGVTPGDFIEAINGKSVNDLQVTGELDFAVQAAATSADHSIKLTLGRREPGTQGKYNMLYRDVNGTL